MSGLLVHEWIERAGGAERVLDAMVQTFPDSDIYCLWNDAPERYSENQVVESWLAGTPLRKHKAAALPFFSPTFSHLRVTQDYDWMLVSSHLFAHHARVRAESEITKFVYVHTPARYIWEPDLDERGRSFLGRLGAPVYRSLDRKRAQGNSLLASNSDFVRQRVERVWDRESIVIHPPVEVEQIQAVSNWADRLTPKEQDVLKQLPVTFILGASRMVPYKRLDAVIDAAKFSGVPAVLAGVGPELQRLKEKSRSQGVETYFVGSVSDELLRTLYQRALALVFPALEDFGIMPVEALAAGTPVIGLSQGGVAETVKNGETGFLLEDFKDPASVIGAVEGAQFIDSASCRARAHAFSVPMFQEKLKGWVDHRTSFSSH